MFSPTRSPSSLLTVLALVVLLLVSPPNSSEGADGFPQGNKRIRALPACGMQHAYTCMCSRVSIDPRTCMDCSYAMRCNLICSDVFP